MRIAICDDEKADAELIRDYCGRFDAGLPITLFSSGAELLRAFQNDYFDLVFLDIEMKEPNGLTVGGELVKRQPPPVIIFTTQSLNYAVRGYGIALRYLPKPIDYETFVGVMRLAADKILPKKFTIDRDGGQTVVSIADITYFEVIRHEIVFHLNDRQTISTRGSLSSFMDQLSRYCFAQPHKSYCVNMDHIDHISRQSIIMTNGETVPIGRSKSEDFQKQFNLYLRGARAV